MTGQNQINEKKLKLIWIMGTITIIVIFFILGFFYEWIWLLWLPISFGILAAYQALSEHFFSTEQNCPNCGTSLDIQSHYCFHCGFQLVKECPNCHYLNKYDQDICQSCANELHPLQQKNILDVTGKENNGLISNKVNYCSNCGIRLNIESLDKNKCLNCKAKIQGS